MNRILAIASTDLRLFLKRKASYVWLFVVPVMFIYFMGFAARGPGEAYNRTPPVRVENADTNFLGRLLLDEMGSQHMWLLSPTNKETPVSTIEVPTNLTENAQQLQSTKLRLRPQDGANEADSLLIEARLVRALVSLNGHLLESYAANQGQITEAGLRQTMAKPDPLKLEARFAGHKPVPSGFNFSLPGNLVMYLMMNLLIFGGVAVASDRRNGVIKRLMSSPVSRLELVLGKIAGLVLLGAVQVVFYLVLGKYLFHVSLGANMPAVALTLLIYSWLAASLGVLVGSVVASEDRVVGICVLSSLLMAALGGCWWPLEIAPPAMKTLALCFPSGWALKALHQLISFGSGLAEVGQALVVLIAYGIAATLAAIKYFRS